MGFFANMLANGTRKAMIRYYNILKIDNLGMSENWYIKQSLSLRFKSWPNSEIESFTTDCSTIHQLSEKIIIYESSGLVSKYGFQRI
ncbi:MAG: hypothetical protein QF864_05220 [SAR202 cluster bacterium]|jgi:hypothetical protein|nr:hypothetical protein [SAR202 cluster bacterium]|tara:strand:- start:50 stop:310 length:261 start_codon:yes stop_codon:yes gene_type:complete